MFQIIQAESAFSNRPAHAEYTGKYDVIDQRWNIKFTGTRTECEKWISEH